MRNVVGIGMALMGSGSAIASELTRWNLEKGGGLQWGIKPSDAPHVDHIEASGQRVSLILHYGTGEEGRLVKQIFVVWPMLRTIPNDTHASLRGEFTPDLTPQILVNGELPEERLTGAKLNGVITLDSSAGSLRIQRRIFPCRTGAPARHRRRWRQWPKASE